MGAVIEVEGLCKDFRVRKGGGSGLSGIWRSWIRPEHALVRAVADVSFAVNEGETLAFIGPNGAGKSTTIKMLTGILHPSAGKAQVLGLTPWSQRQRLAMGIGSVFGQKSQLSLHLPPIDSFDLLAHIYDLNMNSYRAWRDELVALFEVKDLMTTPVRKLSLGQRMRCEVMASLLHRPRILFLDEPTIGIDPVAKATLRDLIRRSNQQHGVTVFLTSHDAGDIEHLCKRVIIVNHGGVVLDGSVNALKRNYLNHKEVGVKAAGEVRELPALDGVEILKRKGVGLKLRVDTSQVSMEKVLSSILQACELEDITIENQPMEDIIASIYRQQSGRTP